MSDLSGVASIFAGDALCFATAVSSAAHLPHLLRVSVLQDVRDAVQNTGLRVSAIPLGDQTSAANPQQDNSSTADDAVAIGTREANPTALLSVDRLRLERFAMGVLTNVDQLQNWAYPPTNEVKGPGDDPDQPDEPYATTGDLPFHPALMDAAALALATPKWPLLVDPDDIALR